MLRFSKPQQTKLADLGLDRFVEATRTHLALHFPRLYGVRGADKTRQWIRYGIEHAKTYDIVEGRDVRRFIDILYARGIGFEDKPEHAWMRKFLDQDERSGRWKMDRIQAFLLDDGKSH